MGSFNDIRITERRYLSMEPLPLLSNGTSDGLIIVENTYGIKVGQILAFDNGTSNLRAKVKIVLDETTFIVIGKDKPITSHDKLDMSAFIAGSTFTLYEANRPAINEFETQRAVFEEEPTVALRTHLVDWLGRSYSDGNPIPISTAENKLSSPVIININTTLANTESSFTLPDGTKRYRIKIRGQAAMQLSYIAGESNMNYWKINRGFIHEESNIFLNGKTLYFQVDKANQVVEITYWT